MAGYTIRIERQLMEQINYNLLFRWFVGFFDGRRGLEPLHFHQEPGSPGGRQKWSWLSEQVIPIL